MPNRTVGLRLAIEKDQEYKQTIQALTRENQILEAEMQKVKAQFAENESSTAALTAKQEIWEKQLDNAVEKVVYLRTALENAKDAYGENDKRVDEYRLQLAKAEAEEIRLANAIEKSNSELEDQNTAVDKAKEEFGGLGDSLDTVADKLGVQIPESAKEALNNMEGFSAGTVAAMGVAASAIAAVYKAASALHELTLEAAANADDLLTRAEKSGLSVELLQGIDYAQRFQDFGNLEDMLTKLTVSMDKARDGAEKQAAAFDTLKISVVDEDEKLRDNWETFKDVIDRLGEIENATERDALSNDLFGKSYDELKPLINAGTNALQEYIDKANESGYVMTEEQVKKLGEVDDAVQENQAKWEALKNEIALEWAPASIQAMELFSSASETANNMLIESGLLTSFEHLIESTEKFGEVGLDVFEIQLPGFLNPIADLSFALDGLATALDWVLYLYESFSSIDFASIEQTMYDVGDMGYNAAAAYNAGGTDNWRGGLTWVGETGPELVSLPRGSQIINTQESEQIAASVTAVDLSRVEQLLLMIYDEFAGMEIRRRMM